MKDEKKKPDTKAEEAKEGAEEKPKKSHKGLIIAIIVLVIAAVAAVCFFSLSGKDDESESAVAAKTETTINADDEMASLLAEAEAAGSDEDASAADGEDASAADDEDTTAADDEDTTVADDEDTTAADDKGSKKDGDETKKNDKESTTKKASNGLTSSDAATVVAYYNAAVVKTNKDKAPSGYATMKLDGEITADGSLGTLLDVAQKPISNALESGSGDTDYIPGEGKLKASDCTSAVAVSKDGKTTILIKLKEQTDGPSCDAHTAGPVARGIGTLGNIDTALDALGAEISEGKENVKLTYKDAYIKCTIDEKTGKITTGQWHYLVDINITSAKLKLVITANVKNMHGAVDYTIDIK